MTAFSERVRRSARGIAGTARRRRREDGYTLVAVLMGVSIVSIALVNHCLLAGYGALASRAARNRFACRQAGLAVLNDAVPTTDGGSLPPAAARDGWHDRVYLDPSNGEIVPLDGAVPAGAVIVDRQWRRGPDADGKTVFEVTTTATDASGAALDRWTAASATYSRRVR